MLEPVYWLRWWPICSGSISSAVIVSRIYAHDDVRKYGSKNAGMTNVLRTYGKLPALFTFLGDFFKGVLAVVAGRLIFSVMGVTAFDAGYLAGFFALLGHLYPIYFGFKGGQGNPHLAGHHPGGEPAGLRDSADYLFAGAVCHPHRLAGVGYRRNSLPVCHPDCRPVPAQAGAVRLFVRPAFFGHCDLETPGQHQAAAQRHRAAHRGEKSGRSRAKTLKGEAR